MMRDLVHFSNLHTPGSDARPGAVAERLHLIYANDAERYFDLLASLLAYYDIPLLHVMPKLFQYRSAGPGQVGGRLEPLALTLDRLTAMFHRKVHTALIVGACIKTKEFDESQGETDPTLVTMPDVDAGPWQQGEIDRRPQIGGNPNPLCSSRSELFRGVRAVLDALAIALRHVYSTSHRYYDGLVVASVEFSSGAADECRKNPRRLPIHVRDYPERGCAPPSKTEYFGDVVLFQLTLTILETVSPPAQQRAAMGHVPPSYLGLVSRSNLVDQPPPPIPIPAAAGAPGAGAPASAGIGGNLVKISFGQGAASALSVLQDTPWGDTPWGTDACLRLVTSAQCLVCHCLDASVCVCVNKCARTSQLARGVGSVHSPLTANTLTKQNAIADVGGKDRWAVCEHISTVSSLTPIDRRVCGRRRTHTDTCVCVCVCVRARARSLYSRRACMMAQTLIWLALAT